VPRRLQNPKRKTIGVRIPDNVIALSLLEELGEPMLSTTLILPGEELPLSEPEEIYERLATQVDLVVDGGPCGLELTTVVDLVDGPPRVLREGKGDISLLGL
jgi:tRNA threonylcarbamoyl adenosine modification protein (Sua5/YciO/YrdC/YwlC family)